MQTQTFTLVAVLVVLTLGESATPTAGQELPVPRIAEAAVRVSPPFRGRRSCGTRSRSALRAITSFNRRLRLR